VGRNPTGTTTNARLAEAPVTGDETLLERLVTNMVDNAERYNISDATIT
jgi:K+-sensing histidine kinase KdpD